MSEPTRTVCVLVERADECTAHALRYAATVPCRRRCALHVAADPDRARALLPEWSAAAAGMPLTIVEDVGGISPSFVAWLGLHTREPNHETVVVVPRRAQARWRGLFRERTSDAIAFELRVLHDVHVEIVTPDSVVPASRA